MGAREIGHQSRSSSNQGRRTLFGMKELAWERNLYIYKITTLLKKDWQQPGL
ncbi:hypothetical protein SCA6_018207 [Theobroma cacao]